MFSFEFANQSLKFTFILCYRAGYVHRSFYARWYPVYTSLDQHTVSTDAHIPRIAAFSIPVLCPAVQNIKSSSQYLLQ